MNILLTFVSQAFLVAAVCLALTGCGGELQPAPEADDVVAPATTTEAGAPGPADQAEPPEQSSESKPQPPATPGSASAKTETDAAPAEPAAAYEPPFPDRTELFAVPSGRGGRWQGTRSEESVELLGFVCVDQPRVVLSIDGQIAPVAEGDERYGVEVISIHEPAVVLQRGRERWQASLTN